MKPKKTITELMETFLSIYLKDRKDVSISVRQLTELDPKYQVIFTIKLTENDGMYSKITKAVDSTVRHKLCKVFNIKPKDISVLNTYNEYYDSNYLLDNLQ
jgi:hypothetical protein